MRKADRHVTFRIYNLGAELFKYFTVLKTRRLCDYCRYSQTDQIQRCLLYTSIYDSERAVSDNVNIALVKFSESPFLGLFSTIDLADMISAEREGKITVMPVSYTHLARFHDFH